MQRRHAGKIGLEYLSKRDDAIPGDDDEERAGNKFACDADAPEKRFLVDSEHRLHLHLG